MVHRCSECRKRTCRQDDTCNTKACPRYRPDKRGRWGGAKSAQATPITAQPLARDHGRPLWRALRSSTINPNYYRLLCARPVIECLDMRSHGALRMCERRTGLSWLVAQPLARADQLRYWVARFLHIDGPRGIELQRHGLSKGCLTRALSCAQDWLDVLGRAEAVIHSLWRDPFLGALVVVRMAMKFELPDARLRQALKMYRSSRQWQILALERQVLEVLPARHMAGDM